MVPVHNGEFEPLQQSAQRWSNRLKQGVAVCNSLVVINKTTVVGADMERSMFKAVEARFLVSWLYHASARVLQEGSISTIDGMQMEQ